MSKYTDGEIREKYESYNDCYENIVQILNDILDAGELTEGSQERLQEAYDDYNEEYAETKEVLNSKEDKSLEDQIKDLTNNKLDADIDSIMSILTKNGEKNTFYIDEDGNLFVDGEQIPELNTVKLTVDEQNKKIEALVSEGTVEINGEKVKLNVAYSQILQTVDGINQTVAKLNKNIEKNYSTTEQMKSEIKSAADSISLSVSNLKSTLENNYSTTEQMKSAIKLSADGITSEVRKYKETLDRATMEVTNEFYVSTSREEPTGGEWVKTLPTGQTKGYIWTRTVTKTTSGSTVYGEPYCLTGAKGEKGDQGLQGLQGEKGEQGIPGKDGRTTYFHIKYSAIGNPTSSSQMTETPDTYIGTYVDFEPNDSDDPTKYTWYMFKGLQGEKGEQGIPGKDGDGRTTYLHIKYSNDGGQTFTSNNGEDVGDYIGTCTDFTKADPTTVSAYTWARIKGNQGDKGEKGDKGDQGLRGLQGEQGEQGIPGIPGKDGVNGKTTYFHIKYSSVENPTLSSQMTEEPSEYIGTYVDFEMQDSTDPKKYTWYRFKGLQGEKGEQGIPGKDGDGRTTYLHIKYSNDGGRTFTSNNGETVGDYIGTCTDFTKADPTTVSAYTWARIKGEQGQQGLQGIQGEKGEQGVAGKDGKTTYFHIKYSSVSNPQYASQMSEIPNIYIGTYVDFTQADSNNPSDYTWYRFQGLQGEKGEQGIPGVGKDGKTSYLHIKYSNDGGQTFTSNNGETVGIYIGTCTDFNQNDPTYVSAYTWNKMKGDTGAGVKEVVNLYFIHTSKTVAPSINSSGWDTKIPAYVKGKYLWKCLKVVYTDNTISYTTPQYAPEWESKQIADEAYSLVTQTNNKISWLVKSGTSESTMELTDRMYSLMTTKVLVEAKKIELTGSVNINDGTFLVQTNGNLKIGGLTGRLNGDGTQQGIFEVTSKGKVYSRNLDSANIYSSMDDGVLEVRNGDIRFRVNANGIQIKNFGTGGGELTMDDKNITADSLTASGKVIAKGGLRSNSYVRGMSLAINNKKFNGDSSTINGSSQSRLFLGDTLIIYGRSSFTKLTANTTKTNEITFDKVGFVNPPVVIATTNSSSPNQCRIGAGSVTTTGFNLYLNRTNTTDTTVFWVAIGERAGSDTFVS